jgi:outer membrane protein assembly factor BamB
VNIKPVGFVVASGLLWHAPSYSDAQSSNSAILLSDRLPGKGLAEHDFLYAGESKNRCAFIVRKGQVVWTYEDPTGRGEISDAVLLSNGNLLVAHQYAIKLISPETNVIWNLDAPAGTEIHTALPIGQEHVLYVQNGDPAVVKVVNISTGETKREFPVPVGNPKSTHGQFRHSRLTGAGTLLLAHMDLNKVSEYNADGREIWSFSCDRPWGVSPLKNGNMLICERREVREITRRGETVTTLTPNDTLPYKLGSLQLAWRLSNGNTLINNWVNEWSGPIDRVNPPVQALELTPDKKVTWVLRSWSKPDLGPATTIQILEEAEAPENVSFGNIH